MILGQLLKLAGHSKDSHLEPQNIFVSEIVISFSDYKLCQTVHRTILETISKIPKGKKKANNKNNLVKKE